LKAVFESQLAREMVESERLRMALLAGLFALLAAVLPLFGWLFSGPSTVWIGVALAAGVVVYELAVRAIQARMLAHGVFPPRALRFWNALVETSSPTLLILLLARATSADMVIQGPVPFLYGLFIILSTLRLDPWLALFTGAVAAVQFAAVAIAQTGVTPPTVVKSLLLLLFGVGAAFVAVQLRTRLDRVLRATEEREQLISAFGQQVSPAVVEELLRQGPDIASRRSFVCVMFMDIRDFTTLVEHRSPEEIVALQNAVFGVAIDVVNRHRGIINQFLGDGFMATFGAPLPTGADCRNALAASSELIAALRERLPSIRIGIGLHAGYAVTGNIGSSERKQYSVTGNVVILAARIEQLNKDYGSQLLASREVLDQCGEPRPAAQPLGPVHVKGREEAIEVYRLA